MKGPVLTGDRARIEAVDEAEGGDTCSEVVRICQQLIRIESVNTGDRATIGDGEARAARYIQGLLDDVGYDTHYVESAPGRGNLMCRLAGLDRSLGALVIHGHLDVVPADPGEWAVPPFSGMITDGILWGRGAIDMKNMVAMMVAVARRLKSRGIVPKRDLIFAFFADEEAGGRYGSHWVVDHHPDWFVGATHAISEVGGFSVTFGGGERAYLVAAAEKGVAWATLSAAGRAGHGSMNNDDNAVTRIADAVARLGRHQFPIQQTDTVNQFLAHVGSITGIEFDEGDMEESIRRLGPISRIILATLRNTANPTMLTAGYKANVIPSTAQAVVDGRVLPGADDLFVREVTDLVGDGVDITWQRMPPLEFPFEGKLIEAIAAALRSEDPDGHVIPYMLSGFTDNKALARLGIAGYGFSPLRLPPDYDFPALFHGANERVPISALEFGDRVLGRLLETY